jgi:DNA-binding response OmpR family regulator
MTRRTPRRPGSGDDPPAAPAVTILVISEDALHTQLGSLLDGRRVVVVTASDTSVTALDPTAPQRSQSPRTESGIIRFDHLEIDLGRRHVHWQGRPLHLSEQELSIITTLAGDASRAFSFRELYASVWGSEYQVDLPMVHSAIRRLRLKLTSVGARHLIQSVRGYGFRLGSDESASR